MNIVHATCNISTSKDEVMEMLNTDKRLIKSMKNVTAELKAQDIEIFKTVGNICIAEDGYHVVLFEKDLQKVENDGKIER